MFQQHGAKSNKPPNSTDPNHKRRISLLNSDFKISSGILNNRFKKVATHSLNPNQLSAGDDIRIHHGINTARDAILAANNSNEGTGILDNDYKDAFDYMVLLWVLKVLKAKGLDQEVNNMILNMYDNSLTVVVANKKYFRNYKGFQIIRNLFPPLRINTGIYKICVYFKAPNYYVTTLTPISVTPTVGTTQTYVLVMQQKVTTKICQFLHHIC